MIELKLALYAVASIALIVISWLTYTFPNNSNFGTFNFGVAVLWVMAFGHLYSEIKVYPNLDFHQRKRLILLILGWPFLLVAIPFAAIGVETADIMLENDPHDTSSARGILVSSIIALIWLFSVAAISGLITLVGYFPYEIYRILTKQYREPSPEPEPEPVEEPPPPLSDEWKKWITDYTPALPPNALQNYLDNADVIVSTYHAERIAPTTNELWLSRRLHDPVFTIGQVQYKLFEQYKALVRALPSGDGYAPFPLFPRSRRTSEAVGDLVVALDPYKSWSQVSVNFHGLMDTLPSIRNGVKRFEGTFILAPPNSGKTTTLNYLITQDLPYVEEGKASILAMDDRGVFVSGLLGLPQFDPATGSLKDKVIIIDPADNPPPQLNPFALGRARLAQATEEKRGELFNTIIDAVSHIFATMGENTNFTDRQRTLFRHCVRLCMVIPDGNMNTLNTIFTTRSVKEYAAYFHLLPGKSKEFFETAFLTKQYQEGCGEVMWRTQGVIETPEIEAILNAPSSIDFSEELNSGKVFLINTNRKAISPQNAAVLGRLIIAMVRIAMRERDPPFPQDQIVPTYFYIDEAHFYLDHDDQIAMMLDDVRASRLALTLVTQRLEKIKDSNVKNALLSVGILLAAPVAADAQTVATSMHCDKEDLVGFHQGQFALFSRHVTKYIDVDVPYAPVPILEPEELKRRKKALSKAEPRSSAPEPPKPTPPAPDDDDDEIRPSPMT